MFQAPAVLGAQALAYMAIEQKRAQAIIDEYEADVRRKHFIATAPRYSGHAVPLVKKRSASE